MRLASWTYWSNDHGGWSPLKPDNTPTAILPQLLRLYPQATAGKLLHYSYDPLSKSFNMEFISDTTIAGPTEIAIPHSLFPNGYKLHVTGTEHWRSEVDEITNTLKIFAEKNGTDMKIAIEEK
jgi:endoglycosylceramidase